MEKNLKDSIEKKVGASEIPDMFSAYNDIAYTIDQMHGIVDLNKYFSDDELDEYIEGYVQDGDILNNGKLKVFPVAKSTEILTINKIDFDIFAKSTNVSSKDLSTIEGLVEVSQKLSISKLHIENKNRACYSTNTQMQSNICNVSIFINSFTSSPDIRALIKNENHRKQINTCLIKKVVHIYWYIYIKCML